LFEKWTNSFDPLSLFIEEDCIFERGIRINRSALYKAYSLFCEGSGYFVMRKGEFFSKVNEQLGECSKVEGNWYYHGVGLSAISKSSLLNSGWRPGKIG
jgi:hypothetical protein